MLFCPLGWPWHFTVHMDGLNTLRSTCMALTLYCPHGLPRRFTVHMDGLDTLRSTWMALTLYGPLGWPWCFTVHMDGLDASLPWLSICLAWTLYGSNGLTTKSWSTSGARGPVRPEMVVVVYCTASVKPVQQIRQDLCFYVSINSISAENALLKNFRQSTVYGYVIEKRSNISRALSL